MGGVNVIRPCRNGDEGRAVAVRPPFTSGSLSDWLHKFHPAVDAAAAVRFHREARPCRNSWVSLVTCWIVDWIGLDRSAEWHLSICVPPSTLFFLSPPPPFWVLSRQELCAGKGFSPHFFVLFCWWGSSLDLSKMDVSLEELSEERSHGRAHSLLLGAMG